MGFADCNASSRDGCEVNTNGDRANCGACGTVCGAGQVCSMGVCVATCRVGLTDCNGSCRDLQADPAACGACGTVCAAAPNSLPVCGAGVCRIICSAGFGDCDGIAANGCEVMLNTPGNCGVCGRACAAANGVASCNMGMCGVASCNPGFADCDGNPNNGCEVNTNNNAGNCGMCGNSCAAPNAAGVCNMGFANCNMNAADGCEVNTNTVANCGMCGRVCSFANATAACGAGSCTLAACTAGFANCDNNAANGCEVNTGIDRNNCGACGVVCPGGQSCSGGACRSFPAACTTGGPLAGDSGTWVVCRADANTAWIANGSNLGGSYSALAICQSFGYARVSRWGGTCGTICGFCTGGTSCMAPQAVTTFDSGGGDPRAGNRISQTVHWECATP